ncbi:MAG: hypothetical protein HYV27_23065 [Candidatus Hydrogenedentes bacterium]|nr:hypothetical protein [Candidatus Hydrogenedentota bacterium]
MKTIAALLRPVWTALDVQVALLLALLAAITAMVYTSTWGGTAHFYQESLGPSVMMACGHGYVNPDLDKLPELRAFLHPVMSSTESPVPAQFDGTTLPADPPVAPLLLYQRQHRYLMMAIALLWALFGIAWSSLAPLYGVLYGVTAIAWYGIMRLGTGRLAAALMTMLLTFSPLQLNNLLRLRDFSKAPFILLTMLLLGTMMKGGWNTRRVLAASAATGVLVGLGAGFRIDVVICIPAFLVVVWFFLDRRPWLHAGWKTLASALCIALHLLISLPITGPREPDMNAIHYLLGLSKLYDDRLGVGGASYQLIHRYLDLEPVALLQSTNLQPQNLASKNFELDTFALEQASTQLLLHHLRTFPADLVLRSWAAVLRTLDELHSSLDVPAPKGIDSTLGIHLFTVTSAAAHVLTRYTRYAAIGALILISLGNLRLALGTGFLLAYFAGYGAIQFASRHTFHLEFIGFWATGTALTLLFTRFAPLRHREVRAQWKSWMADRPVWQQPAPRRAACFIAIALAAVLIPLWSLRLYQHQTASNFFARELAAAVTTATPVSQEPGRDGHVLFVPAFTEEKAPLRGSTGDASEYLTARFDTSGGALTLMMQYDGAPPDAQLSWGITLPQLSGAPVELHFPAYYIGWAESAGSWTAFKGIEVPEAQRGAFLELRRWQNAPFVPATLLIAPGTEPPRYYQQLVR